MEYLQGKNLSLYISKDVLEKIEPITLPGNVNKGFERYLSNLLNDNQEDSKIAEDYKKIWLTSMQLSIIINYMILNDCTLEESIEISKTLLSKELNDLDEMFKEVLEDEDFDQIGVMFFSNLLNIYKNINDKGIQVNNEIISTTIKEVNEEFINRLRKYGIDDIAKQLLKDDELVEIIKQSYIEPIKEVLIEYFKEYYENYEEKYIDVFKIIFKDFEKKCALQYALGAIVNKALSDETNISTVMNKYNPSEIYELTKKTILDLSYFQEFIEETKETIKLLLNSISKGF